MKKCGARFARSPTVCLLSAVQCPLKDIGHSTLDNRSPRPTLFHLSLSYPCAVGATSHTHSAFCAGTGESHEEKDEGGVEEHAESEGAWLKLKVAQRNEREALCKRGHNLNGERSKIIKVGRKGKRNHTQQNRQDTRNNSIFCNGN